MRPLRFSLNVTLDGCYDHTVGIADEELPPLLLTAGELPPAYLRFAFLDTPLARIGGCTLVVARSERVDLVASIEQGYGDGSLTDEEYQGLMTGIDQRHPA